MGKSRDNAEAEPDSPSGGSSNSCRGGINCSLCWQGRGRHSQHSAQDQSSVSSLAAGDIGETPTVRPTNTMPANLSSNNPPRRNSKCGRSIKYRRLRPFKDAEINVLLLENVSPVAVEMFVEAGFQVSGEDGGAGQC